MDINSVILVKNITKKYEIGEKDRNPGLRDAITNFFSLPLKYFKNKTLFKKNFFWALKGVSFEIKRGEVVGIIGKNGAGKSTLLKILSRITEPTNGEAEIRGRVGSLIEVGTGFHEELTGRENIFLNGAILGMKKKEVEERFEDIVKFSGMRKFLDTPIKRYSSGMYVRLAFSVAAHLDTDILFIDEVLSVGDTEFQAKSLGKVKDVAESGRTVIFVSHNMNSITQFCTRCLVIKDGKIAYDGDPDSAISYYLSQEVNYFGEKKFKNDSKKIMQFSKFSIKNMGKKISSILDINKPIEVEVEYKLREKITKGLVSLSITSPEGVVLLKTEDIDLDHSLLKERKPGNYKASFVIPPNIINIGNYYLSGACEIWGHSDFSRQKLDEQDGFQFECVDGEGKINGQKVGVIAPKFKWNTKKIK